MIYGDFKLPDIALYLQDYIDIAYVMQKTVFPRIDRLADLGIDFKRTPKFTGCRDEYEMYLENLFLGGRFAFYVPSQPKTGAQRKAVYFICHAANQMGYFQRPNPCDMRTPNRVDVSMLSGLPPERVEKASQIIKRLFTINENGCLLYEPEVIRQNHFAIFRDARQWPYIKSKC